MKLKALINFLLFILVFSLVWPINRTTGVITLLLVFCVLWQVPALTLLWRRISKHHAYLYLLAYFGFAFLWATGNPFFEAWRFIEKRTMLGLLAFLCLMLPWDKKRTNLIAHAFVISTLVFTIVAVVVAIYAHYHHYNDKTLWQQLQNQNLVYYVHQHHNYVSFFIIISLILIAHRKELLFNKPTRYIAFAWLVVILLLLQSKSLLPAAAFVLLVALANKLKMPQPVLKTLMWLPLTASLLLLIFFFVAKPQAMPHLHQKAPPTSIVGKHSLYPRIYAGFAHATLVEQQHFLGTALSNIENQRTQVYAAMGLSNLKKPGDFHSHNTLLQLLIIGGFVLFGAYVTTLLRMGYGAPVGSMRAKFLMLIPFFHSVEPILWFNSLIMTMGFVVALSSIERYIED